MDNARKFESKIQKQFWHILETKRFKRKYGRKAFSYAGPKLWHALPLNVRAKENIENLKKLVKTILF